MAKKPTYEELEQRVKKLEMECAVSKRLELKLKDAFSEIHHLREALDHVPAYVYMKDSQFRYIYANKLTLELFGCSAEELVGSDDTCFFPPDTVKRLREVDLRVFSGEQTSEEIDVVDSGVNRRVYWEVKAPIYVEPERKTIWGLLGISTDITERKRAEDALRESKERLTDAQKMARIGHYAFDISKDSWTSSLQLNDIFGIDHSYRKTAASWLQIVHPDHLKTMSSYLQDNILTQHQKFNKEYKIIDKKTGQEKWVHGLGNLKLDENNNLIEMFGTIQDITDRKRSEMALQESEDRFRTLFESAPMAIQGYYSDGTIHYWNKGCEIVYGYTKEEAIGKNLIDLIIPPKMREIVRETIKRGSKTGEMPPPEELSLMQKNGSLVPVLSSHIFVELDGKESELYCLDIDMRLQKELQSQLRQSHKMESIGTLTGGVAHDFNNLLYMIVGNIELALEDIPEWNPVYKNLEEIKTASLRAAGIVKQLLNFSRKTDQDLKPIGAVTIIKDALKFLRSTLPNTVEIKMNLPDADIPILGDPVQINQIMMNLSTNASQAMQDTGGTVEVDIVTMILDEEEAKEYDSLSSGKHIKIKVGDSGPGIAPDIIDRIFDPYFTTKRLGENSGMGLAIVHGIVKNHDGAISVDSKPGEGTTFNIFFPVIDELPESKIEVKVDIPHGTEKILFVDDEASIANMTGKTLARLGYQIEVCVNPVEALELFKAEPGTFELVITDMSMPQMTGAKLAEKIKEIRSDIPVIICTGHSAVIDEEKAKQLGIDRFVMKPVSKLKIAKVIREVLDK